MKASYGIHWFRRDLRVTGNPALLSNWKTNEGRVVGVFCFDKQFLARPDFSSNRFQFFMETLSVLREEMRELGSDLLFLDEGPHSAFPALLEKLKGNLPAQFTFNRDYEPYAIKRDGDIEALMEKWKIPVHHERDHLLIEPHEVHKGEDPKDGYVVYTPFSKKWMEMFQTPAVQVRIAAQDISKRPKAFQHTWKTLLKKTEEQDLLESYRRQNEKSVTVPMPPAGFQAAVKRLREFKTHLATYGELRDIPSVDGTSKMSIYLKNGSITVAQIIGELELKKSKYLSELIWREFYYHILFRFPYVEKKSFQAKYETIEWENDKKLFEAWKTGMTGYPIVDAGMRQLNTTGWMHNRVRMIVASFLTKDLLINWQWGERYFMEKLLDGDLAPNNGGWQWAASTGCDPQPYFRIFNPYLQSKKFDPEGIYIREFVPELKSLSDKDIHEPSPALRGKYPAPIVDHYVRRDIALNKYKAKRQPV